MSVDLMVPAGSILRFLGIRYWPASFLPALVGTILPFWLRPKEFDFRVDSAIAFLLATCLAQSIGSLLLVCFSDQTDLELANSCQMNGKTSAIPKRKAWGWLSLFLIFLIGLLLYLQFQIPHKPSVSWLVFPVFCSAALFTIVLFTVPPFHFHTRASGEVVLAEGLGMIPVLGAYLVQVGDLTRPVYLASLPLVVAIAIWVWLDRLIAMGDADKDDGWNSLVRMFGLDFSALIIFPLLIILIPITVIVAVVRSGLPATSLTILLLVPWAGYIIILVRRGLSDHKIWLRARQNAWAFALVVASMVLVSIVIPQVWSVAQVTAFFGT